jgi:FkbM family methyltransferase
LISISNVIARLSVERKPIRFLISRLIWHAKIPGLRIRRDGYALHFSPSALAAQLWLYPKERDDDELFLCNYLRNGDTVVDVGANIGSLSILASRLVGSHGAVLAIEPHPQTFKWLQQNKDLNHCDNLTIANLAVGAQAIQTGISDGKSDDQNTIDPESNLKVNMVQLDQLTADLSVISLLKIDVEGYELEALRGARSTLARTECIRIESFETFQKKLGYSFRDLYDVLVDAGFEILRSDGHSIVKLDREHKSINCENVIAVRAHARPLIP